jgi:hypothetical protein
VTSGFRSAGISPCIPPSYLYDLAIMARRVRAYTEIGKRIAALVEEYGFRQRMCEGRA